MDDWRDYLPVITCNVGYYENLIFSQNNSLPPYIDFSIIYQKVHIRVKLAGPISITYGESNLKVDLNTLLTCSHTNESRSM